MLRTLFLMDEISNYGWVTKWNFLTLGEFQQQIYVQRLELEDAHLGYVESRREQVRKEGQLVMKRKVFETLRLDVFTKWENWRELRNCESTNSPYKNWEKVMWYDAEALFTDTRVAREGAWMIPDNFRRLKAFSHRRTRSDFFSFSGWDHIWRPNWDQHETTLWKTCDLRIFTACAPFWQAATSKRHQVRWWCATMTLTEEVFCASNVRDSPIPMSMTRKWLNSLWGLSRSTGQKWQQDFISFKCLVFTEKTILDK